MVKQCDLYLYYFKVFWCNNGGCILPRLIHSLTKFENSPNLSMDSSVTSATFRHENDKKPFWTIDFPRALPTVSHQKCGARKTPTHSQTWIRQLQKPQAKNKSHHCPNGRTMPTGRMECGRGEIQMRPKNRWWCSRILWCDFANEMTITLIFNRPSKPNDVVNKHIPFFRYSPQNPLSPYQTSSWLTTGIVLQSNHRKSPNPRSSIFAKSTMEITVIMRLNCKFRKLYPYHVYIEIYLTVL